MTEERKYQDELNKAAIYEFICLNYAQGYIDSYTLMKLIKNVDQYIYGGYLDEIKSKQEV